jgi:PAS domain S-box-containing protein
MSSGSSWLDFARRLVTWTPALGSQLLVAAAVLLLSFGARTLANIFVPGVVPFSALYPSILVATLVAGWRSGATVVVLGGGYGWAVVMNHPIFRPAGDPATSADLVNLGVYVVTALTLVLIVHAYRTSARRVAQADAAHLDERERSLQYVRELFERAPGFMAVVAGPDHVFEFANRSYRRLIGARPLEGRPLKTAIPEFPATLVEMLDKVRETGQPQIGQAVKVLIWRRRKSFRDERYLDFVLQPLRGPDGAVERIYLEGFDVTDAIRGQAALRESEARLRLASEAGRLAIWQAHPDRGFTHNAEFNRILGLPTDRKLTGDDLRNRYLPGELERIRASNAAAYARGEREVEVVGRFRRDDGAIRWILLRGELGLDAQGQVRGAQGVAMDITDRMEAEERLSLVAREVDHRANNLLAVLLSMVRLSNGTSVEGLKEVLAGRISALGRAHQLLSAARWEGASLRRIVDEELLAFGLGQDARISVEGPDLAMTPAAAQGLAMALHELSTNALKYGALQAPGGRLSVRWSRGAAGRLLLVWEETGGPPVTPPTRRGLGTTILQRALAGALGGATRLDWRPEGLRCELDLPDTPARARRGELAEG